jgi:hypothetical protein
MPIILLAELRWLQYALLSAIGYCHCHYATPPAAYCYYYWQLTVFDYYFINNNAATLLLPLFGFSYFITIFIIAATPLSFLHYSHYSLVITITPLLSTLLFINYCQIIFSHYHYTYYYITVIFYTLLISLSLH